MMDPITAVGFAASILNFIDYSHKVVTGTIEVFRSGSTAKNVHISEVISDLQDAAKDLTKLPPGRSYHEKALHQLSASCQELAKELTTLLARLSTTDRHSKWTSVRVALRSMRKDGKVAELESTLDKYRSQVLLRLTQIVRYGLSIHPIKVHLPDLHVVTNSCSFKLSSVTSALRPETTAPQPWTSCGLFVQSF